MKNEITVEDVKKKFNMIANKMPEGKKTVPKKEYESGFDTLGNCIFPEDTIPFTENDVITLGPEFISSWIRKNWDKLDCNEKKLFFAGLSQEFDNRRKCRRFFIVLANEILKVSKEDAITPISLLIDQDIKGTKDFPLNKEIIGWIRSIFFIDNKTTISEFVFDKDIPNAKQIALYAIAAAFIPLPKKNKKASLNGQIKVLKWVCNSGLEFELPEYLHQHVKESDLVQEQNKVAILNCLPDFPNKIIFGERKNIQENFQTQVFKGSDKNNEKKNAIEPKETKTIKTVEPKDHNNILEPHIEEELPKDIKKNIHKEQVRIEKKSIELAAKSRSIKDEKTKERVDIEPMQALNILKKYIQESVKQLDEKNQKINRSNVEKKGLLKEIGDLENKLDKQKGKQESLEKKIDDQKNEIRALQSQLENIKREIKSLNVENQKLKSGYENEKQTHQDERKRLSRKIEALSDQKRIETLNRLAESLKTEHFALSQICDLEMSIQNGEKFRSMVQKIFSKITNEGVQFNKSE